MQSRFLYALFSSLPLSFFLFLLYPLSSPSFLLLSSPALSSLPLPPLSRSSLPPLSRSSLPLFPPAPSVHKPLAAYLPSKTSLLPKKASPSPQTPPPPSLSVTP
ncbi:MAG: hypothetical protein HDS14_00220 [Bacteroides sp.]|nr:hypothetical protein [Bacteroides sp.]